MSNTKYHGYDNQSLKMGDWAVKFGLKMVNESVLDADRVAESLSIFMSLIALV